MSKGEEAPEGPDWHDLFEKMEGVISTNQDLFKQGMDFGKGQFSKGQAFVDAIKNYGMNLSGELGSKGKAFEKAGAAMMADLKKAGAEYGKANLNEYNANKDVTGNIIDTLMPNIQGQAELGGDLMDRYTEQGIPFQDKYLAKLTGWDSQQRRGARAAEAVNDISMTSEAARESELRRLESYGIDPSQTRSAALDSRLQAQNAVAKAAAANNARRAVESEGLQLGGEANKIYRDSLMDAGKLATAASAQGAIIPGLAAAPGAQYLQGLGNLADYNRGVAQFGVGLGATGYDMARTAGDVGTQALNSAGTQQNNVNNFGMDVYKYGSGINSSTANMLNSQYNTGSTLHSGDLATYESNQKNSPMAAIGSLVGTALPAVLGAPWLGPMMGAAFGSAGGGMFGGGGGGGGAPAAGTNFLNNAYGGSSVNSAGNMIPNQWSTWSEGGEVSRDLSPSRGAIPDDIPASLNAGEFVIDDATVRWHGVKALRKLQEDAAKGMSGGR